MADKLKGRLSKNPSTVNGSLSKAIRDHGQLTGRDEPDQHPIKSITNLESELDFRPNSALTNEDILNILNT